MKTTVYIHINESNKYSEKCLHQTSLGLTSMYGIEMSLDSTG
jgi:hypothetical protein